jgi:type I restriction enzyme M protein
LTYAAENPLSDAGSIDELTVELADEFLGALAALGGSAGNGRLREALGGDEASYEAVKADLISRRLIVPGRGRGGSVALADGSGVESSGEGQAASRTLNLSRYGDAAEARRQSEHLAQVDPSHWSEQLPDWNDWTA